jgi:riboflavin biosynthesis pyrimidine reductase
MHRLHPTNDAPVTIEEAYARPLGQRSDRPWVALTMVASLDGSTVVDGLSGGLGNRNDAVVFGRVRALADVVIVGSGTARAEGYGAPKKSGQRIGVVTRSGQIDASTDLFTSGSGFVITTETTTITTTPEGVDLDIDVVRAGRDQVDLVRALQSLDTVHPDVLVVHAEGGPSFNGALFAGDLIDEINITTAPMVVGGRGPRLAAADANLGLRFDLMQLLLDDDGYTFARWRRRTG